MSTVPNDLRYAESHEWVRMEDDGDVVIGITDHAQQLLGDMVFVEPPEVDSKFEAGENCGVLESVKAASDMYCPIEGVVIDVNARIFDEPDLINSDPFGEGWIFRLRPENTDDLDDLMDESEYRAEVGIDDDNGDDDE